MKKWGMILQVGFTYIGTIVGAGFATGQEILQFFSQYGRMALWTIAAAAVLFAWLGMKLLLLSHEVGARSYEDLNRYLFGSRIGQWVSLFTLVILFGSTTVMLAGAGSIFSEQFRFSYQAGLWVTLLLSYFVIIRGIHAILGVNSLVVPVMFVMTAWVLRETLQHPEAGGWLHGTPEIPLLRIWAAPLLYCAYNLSMAQAVLVPLGGSIKDRSILRLGGLVGGIGIGIMLLTCHIVLSSYMPEISRFEIPMGQIVQSIGKSMNFLFLIVIFGEILTTYIANVYGLSLQICQRTGFKVKPVVSAILILTYLISQFGFSNLLSTLYPLFGLISTVWFGMIIWKRRFQ